MLGVLLLLLLLRMATLLVAPLVVAVAPLVSAVAPSSPPAEAKRPKNKSRVASSRVESIRGVKWLLDETHGPRGRAGQGRVGQSRAEQSKR